MKKQSQIEKINNFHPRPGVLNLLDIFMLVVGITFTGFLFLYTSGQNKLFESLNSISFDSLQINQSVRHVYNSLNEKLAGNNKIDLEKDILSQFESAQIVCNEMEENKIVRDYFTKQNRLDYFPQPNLICNKLSSLKEITITHWMDVVLHNPENSKAAYENAYTGFFDAIQPFFKVANPQIQKISKQIRFINVILSLFIISLFLIFSYSFWKNRKIKQNHLIQLETEIEQRSHLDVALDTEQSKFSTIITNWPDPILVLDNQGNIILANQAAANMVGVSTPEIMNGKEITDFLPSEIVDSVSMMNESVLKTGIPVLNAEKPFFNKTTGKYQQLAVTKVPIRNNQDQSTGLIWVTHDITAQKQAEESLRVANAKLVEGINELEQRTREMDLLTQMIDLLSACPTEEEAFKVIENQLEKFDLANSGVLYKINPSRNNLEQVAVWGQTLSDSSIFSPGDCWGLRRGRLQIVESDHSISKKDRKDSALICPHITPTIPADYFCLPLVAQGETLGLLHLRHFIDNDPKKPTNVDKSWFNPQKVQHISVIAESLALALANLSLRTTLRQQSIRDPLTGLFNRRYLEETLERELLRASRSQKKLGLIMIDVDYFKQFNDIYGHPAADTVLSKMGHLLLMSIRREDVACRYGGDEFLLMLPDADLDTTLQRAEEIRENISLLSVQFHGQELQQISISMGVGVFPDHGQTQETLIQNVDRALYQSKNNGRNKVSVENSNLPTPQEVTKKGISR